MLGCGVVVEQGEARPERPATGGYLGALQRAERSVAG